MKWKILPMLLFSVALMMVSVLTAGCTGQATEPQVQEIQTQIIKDVTPQEALALIDENQDNPDFVIIDVRTPEEFADGHIENAVNTDFRSESFNNEIDKLDKSKTYLVYCRTANRSRSAVDIMEELGFNKIYHMLGGIVQWEAVGFQITK